MATEDTGRSVPATGGTSSRLIRDEHGVVLDWIVRLVVVGGFVVVVLFDLGAILVNYIGLESTADEVASEVSTLVSGGSVVLTDTNALRDAARTVAGPVDAKVARASVDVNGVFHVRLERAAKTIALGHVGALDGLLLASANGQAGTN